MDQRVITIDTKGLCLVCYSKCSPPNETYESEHLLRLQSFKALMRYIDVDMFKLTNFPSTFLTNSKEATQFSVSMCLPCWDNVNQFFEKFQVWESLDLQLKEHIQQLNYQMKGADQDVARVQEFQKRMQGNCSFGDIFNSSVTDNWRRVTLEKCSRINPGFTARPQENLPSSSSVSMRPGPAPAHLLAPQHSNGTCLYPKEIPTSSQDSQATQSRFLPTNISIPLRQPICHIPVVFTPPEPINELDWSEINAAPNNTSVCAPETDQNVFSSIRHTHGGVRLVAFKPENPFHINQEEQPDADYEEQSEEYYNETKPVMEENMSSPTYKCAKCPKHFYTNQRFSLHKAKQCQSKKQKGRICAIRRIPCTECDMVFQNMGALTRHMKTHSGESELPHKCLYCNGGFNQVCGRTTHMITKHTYQMYAHKLPEGTTEEKFMKELAAQTDVLENVPGSKSKYKCPHCTKTGFSATNLKYHILSAHFNKLVFGGETR